MPSIPAVDWRFTEDPALRLHAALSVVPATLCILVWGLTGGGMFWPAWVFFGLGTPVALHGALRWALTVAPEPQRPYYIHGAVTLVIVVVYVVIWALTGFGYFWPAWPISAFLLALGVHKVFADRWYISARAQQLSERVDELTRTRARALDVQAAELRRIERDLHDGAQARLVALSMQLGRAEERLADQPEVAELVKQARTEAGAAIAELRDLARGIAPPVLADRGLAAAVEGLGRRVAAPVTVDAQLDRRPPPVLETAAYFVVAEALTNISKHAPEAGARVTLRLEDTRLTVEVADDGPGGAVADGNGLTGLRHRVEALDGRLDVKSLQGDGTTIRAEFPCAW